jgi:hypothetical protein
MLERFWFPFGRRNKLLKKNAELTAELAKANTTISRQGHDLMVAHSHIDHLHKEIIDMQMRDIQPVVDFASREMSVAIDTTRYVEINQQEFRVAIRIPTVRSHTSRDNYLAYRTDVKQVISRQLAEAISEHIYKPFTKVE